MRRRIVLGVLAVLVALALFALPRVRTIAGVGTGYAAKVVCSCAHVGGQPFAACVADLPPDFERVTVEPLPDGRGVRASAVFGCISSRAVADPHTGCALQP